jgi:hypothetical protein
MGMGVEAVQTALSSGFGPIQFRGGRYDPNSGSTGLAFDWQGDHYVVLVSREFDDDYLSGTTVGLTDLVAKVKSFKSVIVKTREISEWER